MDLTYIPMARGFVYLVAVLDWYSRKVLSWRVSITMDVHCCLEALEEAIALHGSPEIMNTDQRSLYQDIFNALLANNLVDVGDSVIFTQGDLDGIEGSTNAMKIIEVTAET